MGDSIHLLSGNTIESVSILGIAKGVGIDHPVSMPISKGYRPDPLFARLGGEFCDAVEPARFPKAILRYRNQRQAKRVGLDDLTSEEWIAAFARFESLPHNQPVPLAMRYHGHQFRVYNPDLGDGRGFLFAQLRDIDGRLLDLGTKGSGQTPWSRTADGRLTLKGGVREVLATSMLEGLGVPTSKTFSLVETGEDLVRGDEPSPTRSAVMTRLSYSHIRFGTFQRLAYLERPDLTAGLVDHVVEAYRPALSSLATADRASALFAAIVQDSATLVARWMAAGFVHGVLNTDNMNINGESFDYGPYRFLPRSDPGFTAAYFDHSGLYAFGRQPEAVFWNLQQLAGALIAVTDEASLLEGLNGFSAAYQSALTESVMARLGVLSAGPDHDSALVNAVFRLLAEGAEELGWEPFFFDWFCGSMSTDRALSGPRGALYDTATAWTFRERLKAHAPDRPQRLEHLYFQREAPEALLIDEIEALWAAIALEDDWSLFTEKLSRLESAAQAWDLRP